jgi:site-specific DNA-methyltransferase (adenine-specific)
VTNKLYYGDNLEVLREHVADESVDLIYLDPPFNSNAGYNVLFKSASGAGADASIEAFDDTWTWGDSAKDALMDIASGTNRPLQVMMDAMHSAIGENPLMAYLAMMAVRLVELHRVLKDTGSLYLHCDPTASHYLKLVLDAVFGAENYRNEITWKRRVGMSSAVHSSNRFGTITDTIFFYGKTDRAEFAPQYNLDDPDYQTYVAQRFTSVDENGRRFQPTSLVNPAPRPNLMYDYKGYKSPPNGWMISKAKMEQWDAEGRIYFPKEPTGRLRRKSFADELRGMPVQNLWTDIPEINSRAQERLHYPTQKPRALLERIIAASSNPGDLVLDPFCGCGTAVDAAQKLGRQWIGIDITHIAIGMIEDRMRSGYPGIEFETHGVPKDLDSAIKLANDDKHQFQQWACWQVGGYPREKKGGDKGVDGWFNYLAEGGKIETGVISVKGGENLNPGMVRDLGRVMERDKHRFGLFITAAMPTKGVRDEIASHPLIETEFGRFPAMQVVVIAQLIHGPKASLPPLISPVKKASRVETRVSHQKDSQGALL